MAVFFPVLLALSTRRQPDRRHQLVAATILEQKPTRPGRKRLTAERLVDAQHDDPRRWRLLTQRLGDLHAIQSCDPHIDQSHGWPESNGKLESRFLIHRRGDDFNIISRLEQANEGAADQGIAIHNENSNRFMLHRFQWVAPSKAENNTTQARSAQAVERLAARIERTSSYILLLLFVEKRKLGGSLKHDRIRRGFGRQGNAGLMPGNPAYNDGQAHWA
jgi:hypothetical protein